MFGINQPRLTPAHSSVAQPHRYVRDRASASNWASKSPTIFREGSFRFYFFSREEPRMHVHVQCPDGEASSGLSQPFLWRTITV
jgi:hypothetical protein